MCPQALHEMCAVCGLRVPPSPWMPRRIDDVREEIGADQARHQEVTKECEKHATKQDRSCEHARKPQERINEST